MLRHAGDVAARLLLGLHPQVVEAADLGERVQLHQALADRRVVDGLVALGQVDQHRRPSRRSRHRRHPSGADRRSRRPASRGRRPPCRASPRSPRRCHHRSRGRPARTSSVVLATAQPLFLPPIIAVVGDAGVGEEHLVEHRPAGHLLQRADVDAGLVHVDGEVADALVLRHVRVGAGDQHAQVGHLAAGRPHLLAVDDPLLAVLFGLGLQAGEVGAGAGLGEELAPGALAGDDRTDVLLDLLGRAVRGDGRCGEEQAEPARRAERAVVGDRLLHQHGVAPRQSLAVRADGQRRCRPTGRAEAFPPFGDGQFRVPVLLEPGLHLANDTGLFEHVSHRPRP